MRKREQGYQVGQEAKRWVTDRREIAELVERARANDRITRGREASYWNGYIAGLGD